MKQYPSGQPSEAMLRALGLPTDASRDQVQATRDDLAQLLESAPDSLHGWATSQLALADEALAAYGTAGARPARAQTTAPVASPADDADGADLADVVEPDDLDAPPPRSGASRRTLRAPALSRKALAWVLALVLIPSIIGFVYYFGDKSSATAHPSASASALSDMGASTPTPVPVDPAKEKELQAKVAANSNDTDSMHQLAVMYFKANDMVNAAKWDQEILKVKPNDEDAMLELGVTKYNTNDLKGAEELWQKVVAQNPKNQDAHFDLGFLYLNQDPPQMDKCEAEWQKVIDIDPSSDLAQYVSGYLGNHGASASAKAATPTATKS